MLKDYFKFSFLFFICSLLACPCSAFDVRTLLLLPDRPSQGKWVQRIKVIQPEPLSDITEPTQLIFQAQGMTRAVVRVAHLLLSPEGVELDDTGYGTVEIAPWQLPAGPCNIQIIAANDNAECDVFELQLWNDAQRTAKTRRGMPKKKPVGAKGLKLDFSDDFDVALSVSADGRGRRWNAHKPTFGDFSGWPFSDPNDGENAPFVIRDGYLVIQARKPHGTAGSTGLIAPVDMDGNGYWAKPPFYMECRFLAHSAPGTWPAFWTITNIHRGEGDELDIIEAYGGWGDKAANNTDYFVTTHYWGQFDADGKPRRGDDKRIKKADDDTSWSQDFHTYGLRVDEDSTTYYRDNVAVHRIPTNPISYHNKHVFLINYAIGGASGWHIDLERYGNRSNMYVDYVRVYTLKQ